jgi:hypothetical protein
MAVLESMLRHCRMGTTAFLHCNKHFMHFMRSLSFTSHVDALQLNDNGMVLLTKLITMV